jgi:hypothetical protein
MPLFFLFISTLTEHTYNILCIILAECRSWSLIFRSVEGLLWSAEPRFEFGPALQQAVWATPHPQILFVIYVTGSWFLLSEHTKYLLSPHCFVRYICSHSSDEFLGRYSARYHFSSPYLFVLLTIPEYKCRRWWTSLCLQNSHFEHIPLSSVHSQNCTVYYL